MISRKNVNAPPITKKISHKHKINITEIEAVTVILCYNTDNNPINKPKTERI